MKSYNDFIFDMLIIKARMNPHDIAVSENDATISYIEFLLKVNQYAKWLNKNGITRGDIVGFMMNRSIDTIVTIFSILRVGAAFLAISSSNPVERIDYILQDSMAKMMITDNEYSGTMQGKTILFSSIPCTTECDLIESFPFVSGDDLAYVIYTSGSTGEPKGVLIEYKSIYNRIFWQQTKYPIGSGDMVLQKTISTFDVSVWEFLWWAMAGASLCLLPPNKENSPKAIDDSIRKWNVTALHFVPSVFHLFLKYMDCHPSDNVFSSVKYCFLSGEQVSKEDVHRFYQIVENVNLINLYGPTEATIDVTYFDCIDYIKYDKIPIGIAIDNNEILIIDENNQIVQQGMIGELCISGIQLARSYLNREHLTKEKFVYLNSSKRVYKTGDLAQILPDGNFEYHGRIDRQVKINGIRIELMEIETQMLNLNYISGAVVMLIKKDILIAYYTATNEVDDKKIRADLKKILPSYMIPIRYFYCSEFHLNENGKINYRSLRSTKL